MSMMLKGVFGENRKIDGRKKGGRKEKERQGKRRKEKTMEGRKEGRKGERCDYLCVQRIE